MVLLKHLVTLTQKAYDCPIRLWLKKRMNGRAGLTHPKDFSLLEFIHKRDLSRVSLCRGSKYKVAFFESYISYTVFISMSQIFFFSMCAVGENLLTQNKF